MIRAQELIDELEELRDSLDDQIKQDDIYNALDDLRIRVQQEGVESGPHIRAMVDVNAEQACSDMECSHTDGCPTVKMAACLGCSNEEPNEDGIVWYTKWEIAEWRHHVDYFRECTPDCLHGPQPAPGGAA